MKLKVIDEKLLVELEEVEEQKIAWKIGTWRTQ